LRISEKNKTVTGRDLADLHGAGPTTITYQRRADIMKFDWKKKKKKTNPGRFNIRATE
jgi:hypothetical protein